MNYDPQYSISEVNEAMAVYVKSILPNPHYGRRFQKPSFQSFLSDKMLMVNAIQKGIPFSLFEKIKNNMPFTDLDWASFLNLSIKSLQRYKLDSSFVFKPIHSEKIIELAEVTEFGKSVFDSSEQFYHWLNTPSLALDNTKPLDLLQNSYGKEMVMDELGRIDHGIFI